MDYFGGIDLGKRKSHITVIKADRTVVESVRIENSPEAFRRVFAKYKRKIDVACEASGNSFWVADVLEPLVRKVHVGDTKKIRWIAEARIKTDKLDAGILAELLRADLFPDICIPPKRIRELRELVRGIVRMQRTSGRLRNQVHALLTRHGLRYDGKDVQGSKLGTFLKECSLASPVRVAAESLCRIGEAAQEQRRLLEIDALQHLKEEEDLRSQMKLLESIPGIGTFSSLLFVVELWDIGRFSDSDHLASYIGLVPSTHQSGDTLWHGRMTKRGNALLRWILVQDAWQAIRHGIYFQKLYQRHASKLGKARAIIPVARALLRTLHQVWTAKTPYEEIFNVSKVG